MLSIGITGAVGVGKTTFAELLGEALGNCKVIHGDFHMKEQVAIVVKNRVIDNKEHYDTNDSNIHMSDYYRSPEIAKKTLHLIKDPLNIALQTELMKSCRYSFCIIEWNFLQLLPVWHDFDKRYQLYASWETRFSRLANRDGGFDINRKIILRMNNLADNIVSDDSILISNDESFETLQRLAFHTASELRINIQ